MMGLSIRVLHAFAVGLVVAVFSTWSGVIVEAHEDSLGHGHPDHTLLLHGSGTTNPSRCYWTIMETLMEQSPIPIWATYRGIGSTNGMIEFAEQFNPNVSAGVYPNFFGSGDIPVTQELYQKIQDASPNSTTPQFVHIPVVAGTISFFHSVPDTPNLNLTPCVLSQIYQQQITTWDDDQIQELNPELSINATGLSITVIVRSEGSSSTHAATNYMHTACDNTNLLLPDSLTGELPPWSSSSETFRNCSGSAGVTTCIQENSGAIGYIDSGHGVTAGLSEVRLRNAISGEFFHSQEATVVDALTTDVLPPSPTDDFSTASFLNGPGSNTWPLILMTYLYVRTDLPSFMDSPDEQALLVAFLRTFFIDEYITPCEELFGFTVMNSIPQMKEYATAAIDLVEASVSPNATQFTFESKTNVINGAGPYVFSGKRKEIIDVNLNDLTSTVTSLEEQVVEISAAAGLGEGGVFSGQLAQIQSEIEDLRLDLEELVNRINNAGGVESALQNSNSNNDSQVKAALVLSSLSFIVCCFGVAAFLTRYVKGV